MMNINNNVYLKLNNKIDYITINYSESPLPIQSPHYPEVVKGRVDGELNLKSAGIISDYIKSQKSSTYLSSTLHSDPAAQNGSPANANGFIDYLSNENSISNEVNSTQYINSLTKFNQRLAKNQIILYQFNKANNKPIKFLFDKTSKLLKSSFLAMGCLISKPIFKLTYSSNNMTLELDNPILVDSGSATNIKGLGEWTHVKNTPKILIDLSYFIRKNKNKYLNNNVVSAFGPFGASGSGLNNNILHISHLDNNAVLRTESNSKVRNNILCKYNDKFQFLTDYLTSSFKSEVELDLVRLSKVFYDSNILVQDLALKSYRYRFVKLVSRLFNNMHIQKPGYSALNTVAPITKGDSVNSLITNEAYSTSFPSYLSGVNIKLAGRTFRQRVVPRMTVKRIQKGSLTNINVQFIEKARFTGKTRRGSFSFTVTLGHIF